MGGEAAEAAEAAQAAGALRAVTRHAGISAVERQTWREWGQSNPMKLASLASLATLAAGGTGLAIGLARARRRADKQSKTTKELVDMHINAQEQRAVQREIEETCVSRVHDLHDARLWGSQARREAALVILQRILDEKTKRRSQRTASRVLLAQIGFLEAAIAGFDRAPLHVADDADGENQPRTQAQSAASRPKGVQMAPQKPPELPVPMEVASGPSGPSSGPSGPSVVPLSTSAISSVDMYRVTNKMKGAHNGVHAQYGHIATWDVRLVYNMNSAFRQTEVDSDDLEDLSFWDTRKVQSMRNMFQNAVTFNGDISSWNTSNVTDMMGMFNGASSFNQPLDKWNVSQVVSMKDMFHGASDFNQDISGWKLQGDNFGPSMLQNMLRAENLDERLRSKIEREWSLSQAQKQEACLWLLPPWSFGHSARRVARGLRVMI